MFQHVPKLIAIRVIAVAEARLSPGALPDPDCVHTLSQPVRVCPLHRICDRGAQNADMFVDIMVAVVQAADDHFSLAR